MVRSMPADATALFETPAPEISTERASALLMDRFNIKGTLEPLVSERDLNYRVRTEQGSLLLKFSNAAEPATVTDFQTAALQHLGERCPELTVPRVLSDCDGNPWSTCEVRSGSEHALRLFSWVEGKPLRNTGTHDDHPAQLGRMLALVDGALSDFAHPAEQPPLLWDMMQAPALTPLCQHVDDAALQDRCLEQLRRFQNTLKPSLASLRTQTIYNDLNHSNALVTDQDSRFIAGLIDFGDVLRGPLIVDVAVACAYLCQAKRDPYSQVRPFLRGYQAQLPLESEELAILHELIRTRMVMTILITRWRARQHPENQAYILRNEPQARTVLAILSELPATSVFREL